MIAREKHAPFVCIAKSEKSHDPSITVESTSITAYHKLRSTTSSIPYGRIITNLYIECGGHAMRGDA